MGEIAMEQKRVQKLARVLRELVSIVLICNLAALFFAPGMVLAKGLRGIPEPAAYENFLELPQRLLTLFVSGWNPAVWMRRGNSHGMVLAVFLLFCGVCTAGLLWQARRILGTIQRENPFCGDNAVSMRRAAVCCFLISAAALVRTCWGLWYYRLLRPLLTYNALFCPLFLMAGLLCMVMSALFRQAARLKEENDLTI